MIRRFEFERANDADASAEPLFCRVSCRFAKDSSDEFVKKGIAALNFDLQRLGLREGYDYEWVGFSMVRLKNDVATTSMLLASEQVEIEMKKGFMP